MVEYLEKERCGLLFLRLDRFIQDALPFFWTGYHVIPYYTYILDLSASKEQMLAICPRPPPQHPTRY